MKPDPIETKVHPSTASSHASHRQTVPVQDELEAPPPYTPSTSTSAAPQRPTPVSPASARSSQSSEAGEDVPLQRRRSTGGGSGNGDRQGYAPNETIAPEAAAEDRRDIGYAAPAPMTAEPASEIDWDSQPGCCCSSTGGCFFSDHGGCCFSSYGGCCFSSNGGCCFSDNGGCFFSSGVPPKQSA